MADAIPGLEVGFAIDTGGSYDELLRLQEVMGSAEARIKKEATNIERSTGKMFNVGGAAVGFKTAANEASRETHNLTKARNDAERAGERFLFSLNREVETFGKSRFELRQMQAETRALAAEKVGLTDLAGSIRAVSAQRAQQQRAAEQAAEASRRAALATEEAARAEKAAGVAAQQMARDLDAVRASIDPTFVAQQRLDAELARADRLFDAGKLSAREYGLAVNAAADNFGGMLNSTRATAAALGDVNGKTAQQKAGFQQLGFQLGDFTTQVSSGTSATQAFAQQIGQTAQAVQLMSGGTSKFATFIGGPWGIALTVGVTALAGFVGWLLKSDDAAKKAKDSTLSLSDALDKSRYATDAGRKAIDDYIAAQKRQRDGAEGMIALNLRQAESDLQAAKAVRERLAAELARRESDLTNPPLFTDPDTVAAYQAAVGSGLRDVIGRQSENQKDLARLAQAARDLRIEDSRRRAAGATDPVARFGNTVDDIVGTVERAAAGNDFLARSFGAVAGAAEVAKKAMGDASKEQERANRANPNGAGVSAFKSREQAIGMAGKELQGAGFRVDGNVQFGVTGGHANNAAHNRYAIDVNVGKGITEANVPDLKAKFDKLALLYQSRGYDVIWNKQFYAAGGNGPTGSAKGHMDHLHVQAPGTIIGKPTQSSTAKQAFGDIEDAAKAYEDLIKPYQDVLDAGKQFSDGLHEQTAAIGKTAIELHRMRVEQEAAALTAAALAAPTAELQDQLMGQVGAIRARGAAWEEATKAEAALAEAQKITEGVLGQLASQRSAEIEQEVARVGALRDSYLELVDGLSNAGRGMAEAFGPVGQAIDGLTQAYIGYNGTRSRLDAEHAERAKKLAGSPADLAKEQERYAQRTAMLQVGAFGDATAAAKGFFKSGSDGYKALASAEKAFRAIEFALSVRAIAQDAIETGSSIAKSATRSAALGVEAVVKAISSLPFPLNLAAGAATAAAITALGVSIIGSFGGSNKPAPTNRGTGTVFGDSEAKSESIKRSIDQLKEVDTVTSVYARQMAASLRSIENQIGGLASLVVRAGNVNADLGVNEGFKTNAIGSVLSKIPVIGGILGGLFGTKTTVKASGLFGGPQSLSDILGGGFDASYFSDVQKKKKLFGFTTSNKTKTQFTDADTGLESQFTLLLNSFNNAILAAAGPLGTATKEIQDRLNGFVLNIGKIDLKDLTGAEIEEKLNAVFGAAADNMARAAFPMIDQFQKVGEGAFETLVRVSSTIEAVSDSLDLLGKNAAGLGIQAKVALADQFDTLSDFTGAIDTYFDTFYTKEEQATARTAQLNRVFGSLGLSLPATMNAFRALVEAQDLTTAAGQETYAILLQLAPAFADLRTALESAKSAADVAAERQDLERQLLELRGDTAALRAIQLAKLDASNRDLQKQIYDLQDAQEAARAAEQLRDAWKSVGDTILDEVKRIRGLSSTGGGSFASLLGQFNAANAAARGGDKEAAESLPRLSQELLRIAADVAASRQELDRVQAQTATVLEQTYAAIQRMNTGAPSTAATDAALVTAAAQATQAVAPQAANDDTAAEIRALRADLAQLRADNNAGHAATAGNTARVARHLDNVTTASGGDAISTTYAA